MYLIRTDLTLIIIFLIVLFSIEVFDLWIDCMFTGSVNKHFHAYEIIKSIIYGNIIRVHLLTYSENHLSNVTVST